MLIEESITLDRSHSGKTLFARSANGIAGFFLPPAESGYEFKVIGLIRQDIRVQSPESKNILGDGVPNASCVTYADQVGVVFRIYTINVAGQYSWIHESINGAASFD